MFPCWEQFSVVASRPQMTLLGKGILTVFARKHAGVREPLSAWVFEVEAASWSSPIDVRARFATVSFVGNSRAIFNLKGNQFRLDTQINYSSAIVLVRRIGTHAEYDSWKF